MGFYRGPNIITNGLLVHLDAGSLKSYPGSGTSFKDVSGNKNNSTLTNGPTYNSANFGSIVLDGSNDYIDIPHGFNTSTATGITLDSWFKCSRVSFEPLLADWYNGVWSFDYQIYQGTIGVQIRNGSNQNIDGGIGGYPISTNIIYNIVVTYNSVSKSSALYTNGSLFITGSHALSDAAIRNTSNNWSFGYKQDSGNYFSGNLYNAKIYNRSLSTQEVLQNYNAIKSRYNLK